MSLIALLDFAGLAMFAATGALAASRKELDIIGFLFLAAITGIGGGTARDLMLDVPVFWIEQPNYVVVCAATAIGVYFTAHLIESRYRVLLWLDAVALSAFSVYGAFKGLMVTSSPIVAVVMGMITATLGGIIRDVIAREPSVLMRQEIYVAAALIGAVVFVVGATFGTPIPFAASAGFLAALAIRGGAINYDWSLPTYRSRPGRDIYK